MESSIFDRDGDDPSPSAVPADRFWAKLHPRENPREWHPLIAHSADVAAVLEQLVQPSSGIGRRLATILDRDTLTERQRAQLVFFAALHDIGKTSHGFQTKAGRADDGRRWRNLNRGHVQVLLNSLRHRPLREVLAMQVFPRFSSDSRAASDLFGAIIAHHGRPYVPRSDDKQHVLWQQGSTAREPLREVRRIIDHALAWSGLDAAAGEPLPSLPPAFTHLFAGALTLADWIGSTRTAFEFATWADDDPDGYWVFAQKRAAEVCARIGVVPRTCPVSLAGLPLLEALFPETFGGRCYEPTSLQRYVSDMVLPGPGARLLIESETGSGKTEAALALYTRLRAAGLVSGLMFALPTRATASAMYERVVAALAGMYEPGQRPTVALAVGGQQPRLETNEEWVREASERWSDQERADSALESWASSHSKKYLAAEIVVGTLDQVLLGGLPVKHAHLRLAALSRHLIVVDELHSFDRYMTAVLENLLELHSAAGGMALFMSATLSSEVRHRFAGGKELTFEEAVALPYPTIAVSGAPGTGWDDHALRSTGRSKEVRWNTVPEGEVARRASEAASAGARVCILCNTVRRARKTMAEVRDVGHRDLLWRPSGNRHAPPYHSRYSLPDRLALDDAVRERFGKGAAAARGGVILVATQVVEQSLDVDFDLLITDICPVDVLLQRIGRLHRHPQRDAHRPPGYRMPIALVVAPDGGFGPYLKRRSVELGWGEDRPYPNYADGELTLRTMADHPEIVIPRDNRMLVELVYHPDRRESLWEDAAWSEYLCKAETARRNREWMGEQARLKFDRTYTGSATDFDNAQERSIRTRLGDETVRVELPAAVHCWYSEPHEPICWVDLPAWALPHAEEGEWELPAPVWDPEPDGTARFRLGNVCYRYGPEGWEWTRV
ncbi:MAG TPA: CRISPR-associated helicase Cas3' [Longimicrobiaceae bacterium]|nr:CRISPR-associated helicase Cas3' [Longimicrobiaceae bacterium]